MNKKWINAIIIIAFMAVTIYVFLTSEEITTIYDIATSLQPLWLGAALFMMVVFHYYNSLVIYQLSQELDHPLRFREALYLSFVGQYYSLITPFASGGQPAQLYVMQSKYEISIAKSTAIIIKKFIIYQVVVSVIAILMFLYKFTYMISNYTAFMLFIVAGLAVNLGGGIVLVMLAYNPEATKAFVIYWLRLLKKLRFFRHTSEEKVHHSLDDYSMYVEEIRKKMDVMLRLTFYTAIQLLAFFSITYFVYLSLGQSGASYLDVLAIQTVVYVVVSFIPTPGGAGASEGSFYILFGGLFSREVLLYGMALWRIIVYYGNMLVSGVVILIDNVYRHIKET